MVAISPASAVVPLTPAPPADPVALHPALWRAHQLGRTAAAGQPTGFDALDAVLPGGGWPCGALTELLLPHPGVGEWRLLAPALAVLQQGRGGERPRSVLLVDPPAQPCAWTLAALGLDLRQLVVVQGPPAAPLPRPGRARHRPGVDALWAVEQALASGQVGAVLAWLPARLPADALRRLQLAAQAHAGPAFLFREAAARVRPSAAPLRLVLGLTPGVPDQLQLDLVKRRGPPLAAPLRLALPPVLSAAARERAGAVRSRRQPAATQPA